MPHLNNLDLAIFLMISKRHSALLQNYLIVQAPTDEIWRTAEQVWIDLGSAEIAGGFILAYCIAKKVIDCGGENTFLQKQEFHSRVREDFYFTPYGVSKKTRVVDSLKRMFYKQCCLFSVIVGCGTSIKILSLEKRVFRSV
jgi:hypothetical protein